MRTNLNVTYSEKDIVKRMGARWDPGRKTWYVENVKHISKFMKWLPEHLKKPCNHKKNKKKDKERFVRYEELGIKFLSKNFNTKT